VGCRGFQAFGVMAATYFRPYPFRYILGVARQIIILEPTVGT